ncbi:MAG TPA: type VI secretion system-associated FHA domain protein TagH [Steroidobacteraceae bacterium]|jgi:type VI secretion system protein|nr:type VI secretion system-associated FHA domain protein TagH [Steroidobacteraceae bacterium]
MALRLRVVSEHAKRLGENGTKVFGVHGGTIGRSTANEWILPDPERYLSGKHLRVDFRAGTYVLVDTSSNGTYINGSHVPLGKYHDYLLKDGDYIRLGEYELLVSIDKSNDFPPEEGAIVAYDGRSPSGAARKSTSNDLGEDLDLSQLLEPSDSLAERESSTEQSASSERNSLLESDSGVRPRDAYGQSMSGREPASSLEPEDASGTPWHMMTRPFKVESPKGDPKADASKADASRADAAKADAAAGPAPPRAPAPLLYDSDFEPGLTAFCRGAGVDPRNITPEARSAALQLAGQLLRESVLGLMDLNQGRNDFRNRFRIAPPPSDAPESALNLSRGVDEALVRLLNTLSARAGSVDAVRQNFRELKAQTAASLTATRAAFEEFLTRVDPTELEERFERAAKRGMFGSQNKSKYWDLYREMFPGLAQRPDDGFPHVFIEAFAKTYEAKLRTLVPPRRGGFGADRNEALDPPEHAVGDQ